MASLKDLENHLQTGKGLPRVVLYSCVADHDADNKQILEAMQPHIVGIRMNVNKIKNAAMKEHVVRCVRKKIEEHPDINPLTDDDDEGELEVKENCNIEMRERSQIKSPQHGDLTAIILYASLGLLAATLIAGSAWDMTRSREQGETVEGILYHS